MPSVIARDAKCPRIEPSTDEIAKEIKARVTIPILGEKLYPGWTPSTLCRSPFRKDTSPSFSVYDNGMRWKDHGTGESGDIFDFYERATGKTKAESFLALKEMVGGPGDVTSIIRAPEIPEERKKQFHPTLLTPSVSDLDAISNLRSISVAGLKIAVDRGFLFTAVLKGIRSLVITDKTRRNYLARRMDGKPWEHTGSKAYMLPGSSASWPIGAQEAADYPAIALCEGGPDFLAAFGHALASEVDDRVAPVCMASASSRIPDDALPYFKGKRIRIFVQDDQAGEEAGELWAGQLLDLIPRIDGFSFGGLITCDGSPVTDLNDLTRVDYDCWEQNRETIEGVMNFASGS